MPHIPLFYSPPSQETLLKFKGCPLIIFVSSKHFPTFWIVPLGTGRCVVCVCVFVFVYVCVHVCVFLYTYVYVCSCVCVCFKYRTFLILHRPVLDKPVVHFVYCIHEIVVDSIVPIISIIIKYNARMKDRHEKFR